MVGVFAHLVFFWFGALVADWMGELTVLTEPMLEADKAKIEKLTKVFPSPEHDAQSEAHSTEQ